MRDEKEERKKQARSNKQGKATQHMYMYISHIEMKKEGREKQMKEEGREKQGFFGECSHVQGTCSRLDCTSPQAIRRT